MARRKQGTNRIVVDACEFRWVASVNYGRIRMLIWPANDIGPAIQAELPHDIPGEDPILITNRLIRRVIDHAITADDYTPNEPGFGCSYRWTEDLIEWSDAERVGTPTAEADG